MSAKNLFPFLIVLTLLIAGCSKDPCDELECVNGLCVDGTCECFGQWTGVECDDASCLGIECLNGGTCVSGNCECAFPFFGARCDSLIDARFRGLFDVSGDCTPFSYIITITSVPVQPGNMEVNNLEENGLPLDATVVSEVMLEIPTQTLNGVEYTGSVTFLSPSQLAIEYSVDQNPPCSILLDRI
jgi:hypothetical protein